MFRIALASLLVLGAAPGGPPKAIAPAARPDCSGHQYRDLDFWLGDWVVFDSSQGYRVATSRVERVMNGCSVKESYDSPKAPGGPYSGTSYSGYDRKDGKWHQMYVDVNGNVTLYVGGLEGKAMVLVAPGPAGSVQRMTYRPLSDGAVQQVGLVSTDGGTVWKPGYDYTYRKR